MERSELKDKFKQVFGTPQGKIVLKHIQELCGIKKSSLTTNQSGEINVNMTLVKEGKRAAWIKIAEMIDDETLKEIEIL